MVQKSIDLALAKLDAELALMAGMVENSIDSAVELLSTKNKEMAERLIKNDDEVDEKELTIEDFALETMRREAPLAGDLRKVVSALRISGELERIGDYAEGIGRIVLKDAFRLSTIEIPKEIFEMAKIANGMLKESLRIYFKDIELEKTKELLKSVGDGDEMVDKLYEKSLVYSMKCMTKSSELAEEGTYLIWVSHNLERIADRAVNIAERAYFQTTGEQITL